MKIENVFQRTLLFWTVLSLALIALPTFSANQVVYRIPIDGTIDRGLAPYVSRVLLEARNAEAVILEVNTLGGRVDAAIEIRDAVMDAEVPTIAFINKRAISAGALISLAAEHIVMSSGSTIGAATPVQLDVSGKANPVTEKYVSYFRSEMRSTAEKNGRDGKIAEAMVDADVEIEGVSEKGKLLTLTTDDALQYGISDYEADNLKQVLALYELDGAEIITVNINWAERIVRFLTDPIVSSLLMTIGMIGLFIEFRTPGFGVGGIVGLLGLGLFFWGHFIVRLAGWEDLVIFLAGLVLLLIEIFVIPGFGIVGILGIIAVITSLTLAMVGRVELMSLHDIQIALSKVVAAFVASVIVSIVLFKFFPRTAVGRQVILEETEGRQEGYVAQAPERSTLVGKMGLSLTSLHPSGTMLLNNTRYDVVSEGEFIEKNRQVVVLEVEGARIVVREVQDEELE